MTLREATIKKMRAAGKTDAEIDERLRKLEEMLRRLGTGFVVDPTAGSGRRDEHPEEWLDQEVPLLPQTPPTDPTD